MARALAMVPGGAALSAAIAVALGGAGLVPSPPAAGAWIGGLGGLALLFLASNLALQYGAARLSANVTAVVMVSEVLFASVSAVALGAGVLTWPLVAGGALIVGAALLAVLRP
jgi:drug/metabolite transporter (DMT)-like permease